VYVSSVVLCLWSVVLQVYGGLGENVIGLLYCLYLHVPYEYLQIISRPMTWMLKWDLKYLRCTSWDEADYHHFGYMWTEQDETGVRPRRQISWWVGQRWTVTAHVSRMHNTYERLWYETETKGENVMQAHHSTDDHNATWLTEGFLSKLFWKVPDQQPDTHWQRDPITVELHKTYPLHQSSPLPVHSVIELLRGREVSMMNKAVLTPLIQPEGCDPARCIEICGVYWYVKNKRPAK
jgi:hypothetical protein